MIWKDQCSCQNLSLSLHFIYNLSLGLYLTFYIKHFQTFKQQNAPRCLIFWMVIIIFFVFLLDDEASLVIFTVMFKYFFFNYHQPSWHRVSAFFEFSECHVFFFASCEDMKNMLYGHRDADYSVNLYLWQVWENLCRNVSAFLISKYLLSIHYILSIWDRNCERVKMCVGHGPFELIYITTWENNKD